jgi:hypothetical protein
MAPLTFSTLNPFVSFGPSAGPEERTGIDVPTVRRGLRGRAAAMVRFPQGRLTPAAVCISCPGGHKAAPVGRGGKQDTERKKTRHG